MEHPDEGPIKVCVQCQEAKPLTAFPHDRKRQRRRICRPCVNAALRARYANDPVYREHKRAKARQHMAIYCPLHRAEATARSKRRYWADPELGRLKARLYALRAKHASPPPEAGQ